MVIFNSYVKLPEGTGDLLVRWIEIGDVVVIFLTVIPRDFPGTDLIGKGVIPSP